MDGYITEYACVYGNSGNYPKRRREILLEWVYLNTMHVWRQIAEKDIGSAPTSQRLSEPCKKKD